MGLLKSLDMWKSSLELVEEIETNVGGIIENHLPGVVDQS